MVWGVSLRPAGSGARGGCSRGCWVLGGLVGLPTGFDDARDNLRAFGRRRGMLDEVWRMADVSSDSDTGPGAFTGRSGRRTTLDDGRVFWAAWKGPNRTGQLVRAFQVSVWPPRDLAGRGLAMLDLTGQR